MNKAFKQLLSFVIVSGMGFSIDFIIYFILINFMNLQISYANIISAIPAITYVFMISIKKIFKEKKSNINLKIKYMIYFIYQVSLITLISILAQFIYKYLVSELTNLVILTQLKIIIKLMITPITMICNFIMMKFLSEKL
ncbi:MAG: GtrA family protein [Clostridium butyricum]